MVASTPTESRQQRAHRPLRSRLLGTMSALGVLAVLLAGATGYLWWRWSSENQEVVGGLPAIGGPFTLINAEGKPVTDRDFLVSRPKNI